MPTPKIESIRHLKNVGIFSDINRDMFPYVFRKFNLIYGFNGCGKTTLSRLFGMLSENRITENLPDNAEFSFALSDGKVPSHDNFDCALNRHIAVFNEDYIERSLTWKEGTAQPIIYLGTEQVELASELKALEGQHSEADKDQVLKAATFVSDDRAFTTLCTDRARLIAEQLGAGRTYNATSLKADYASLQITPDDGLFDEDIKKLRTTITRADLPEKVGNILISLDGDSVQVAIQSALKSLVSDISIEALQRRKDALDWVNAGLHLHLDESECLFCGNDFTENRAQALKEALQSGFGKFSEILDNASEMADNFRASCRNFREQLNKAAETLPQHRTSIDQAKAAVHSLVANAEATASQWGEQLGRKRTKPDEEIVASLLAPEGWNRAFADAVSSLNYQITANNAAIDNFENERRTAKLKLKRHYLFEGKDAYESAKLKSEKSEEACKAARRIVDEINQKISELRAKLKSHGLAAPQLNSLLHGYLGHKHISVETVEEGYRICRDGKESRKPLSEGEKTALAFCYFLTALNSEGRKTQDLVIVLDDPISSLDARAMTHVVRTVRQNLAKSTQLFVLTHNLDFMCQLKKWLYPKNKKAENIKDCDIVAGFFFIETVMLNGHRLSKIVEMPHLIRDYDSEYHYLYSLLKSLCDKPNDAEQFAYLMPNAIRKVLEIFFAFKIPGGGGIGHKINTLIQNSTELDGPRISAMLDFAQIESHADSIGDIVTFSAYTLHQVADAADCLMGLIEWLDPNHKKAMDGLCR